MKPQRFFQITALIFAWAGALIAIFFPREDVVYVFLLVILTLLFLLAAKVYDVEEKLNRFTKYPPVGVRKNEQ